MPRAENEAADTLSKLGSTRQAIPAGISLEHLWKPSIKPSPESDSIYIPAKPEPDVIPMDVRADIDSGISGTAKADPGTSPAILAEIMLAMPMEIDRAIFTIHVVPSWAQQIMSYLQDGSLPAEEDSVRRVQRRAKAYTIINAEIYKRSVTSVLQRCIEPEEGQEILRDIH